MKNIKRFEGYNDNKCEAQLKVIKWSGGTFRLVTTIISPDGDRFQPDAIIIGELKAKELINKFGAEYEERI